MRLIDRIATFVQGSSSGLGWALSAVWLVLVLLFWLLVPGADQDSSGVGRLLSFVGVTMPLALIWLAVALSDAIATLRAEADDLRQRLSQLRDGGGTRPDPGRSAAVTMGGGIAPAPAASSLPINPARARQAPQPAPRSRAVDSRQTSMPLDDVQPVQVPVQMLVQALNFPDGQDDTETIVALRTALKDQDHSRVLRAAQDVITLLAGHDLYMDNLLPEPAPVSLWRRFAEGARGQAISGLGGIHDQAALEVVTTLLAKDEIFRDSAHHFLRNFDIMLTRNLAQLDDDQVKQLSDSRSARAFMLLGRAAGVFG